MKESEKFLSYGELGKYLHEYRYESSYYQKSTKGFFDLGDIAALIKPDLAPWEVTDCFEVDWDLTYKFKKTTGSILRCYDINRDKTFDLLHDKLKTLCDR